MEGDAATGAVQAPAAFSFRSKARSFDMAASVEAWRRDHLAGILHTIREIRHEIRAAGEGADGGGAEGGAGSSGSSGSSCIHVFVRKKPYVQSRGGTDDDDGKNSGDGDGGNGGDGSCDDGAAGGDGSGETVRTDTSRGDGGDGGVGADVLTVASPVMFVHTAAKRLGVPTGKLMSEPLLFDGAFGAIGEDREDGEEREDREDEGGGEERDTGEGGAKGGSPNGGGEGKKGVVGVVEDGAPAASALASTSTSHAPLPPLPPSPPASPSDSTSDSASASSAASPSNRRVYDAVMAPLVRSCLGGRHATAIAFGQTGSGKTYVLIPGSETP